MPIAMVAPSERVQKSPERGSFIGGDVALLESTAIPGPGYQDVKVGINSTNFPQVRMRESISSKLAQAGIKTGENAWDQMRETMDQDNGQLTAHLRLENLSERPYVLSEGLGLLRFAYLNNASRMVGDELSESIGEQIQIEGEKGSDWNFTFTEVIRITKDKNGRDREFKEKIPVGIWLLLSADRKRIRQGRFVTINGTNGNYRKQIDDISEPVIPSIEISHWFVETIARARLKGVHAQLHRAGRMDSDGMKPVSVTHYPSWLYDDERTDWNLRAEFYGNTLPFEAPDVIELHFHKAA